MVGVVHSLCLYKVDFSSIRCRSIKRDNNGKMLRIVFCNEGPEVRRCDSVIYGAILSQARQYYEFLGEHQPDTLVELYQKLNPGFDIQEADLFVQQGGKVVYNPYNKWNNSTTTGSIMHL